MGAIGTQMTRYVTLPIAAIGVASVAMAVDFDKSMTKIRALVGASDGQMKQYRATVLSLSKQTGQGPKELAEALYFVTSSGFEGASALRVLTASAKASAAGLGDTATIADAVTSAVNAYGEANLSASKATDILLAAVREGKNEPEELAGSIGRVIPVAEAMGVSFGEVAGTMAALSLNGTNAEEAVTQIVAGMSQSIKPTQQGAKALASLNMTYADLRKQIKDKGLIDTFNDLKTAFGGNVEQVAKVFGNIRALRGVMTLTGPAAAKYKDIIEAVGEAQGDTNRAFGIAAQSPAQKFAVALSKLKVAAIEMGAALIPIALKVVGVVSSMAEAFSGLGSAGQTAVIGLAAIAMVTGPILRLAPVIATLTSTIGALTAAGRVGGLAAFGSSLAAALGPAGIVVAAVAGTAALTYGIVKLGDHLSGATDRAEKMKKAVDDLSGPNGAKLAAWADKALGGHVVSKAGRITWQPAVEIKTGKPGLVANWVRSEAAKEHAARVEALQQQKIDQAKAAQAYWEGEAQRIAMSRKGPGGADPKESTAYKNATREAQFYGTVISQLSGKMQALTGKNWRLKLGAHVEDLQNAIKQQEAKVKKFAKGPHNVKMDLKEAAARRKLAALRGELKRFTGKHYEGLLILKIEKAKARIKDIDTALESARAQAKKGVDVGAKIDRLTKAKAKASAQLKALQAQKTEPKVGLQDNATSAARNVRANLVSIFGQPITQIVNVQKSGGSKLPGDAVGRIVTSPRVSITGEAGPEAIIPLDNPARALQLISEATALRPNWLGKSQSAQSAGGGRSVSSGSSSPMPIHVTVQGNVYGVDDLVGEIYAAMEMRDNELAMGAA
jgi:TP901 family phage tail tape measure protein